MRPTLFFLLCCSLSLGAQLQGTWRVLRYFSLEIDPRTQQIDAREVNSPAQQFLLLTGRELQLAALSPERIPYVITSRYSFLFKIDDRQYRGVLLDDILYVQIEGARREAGATGPGYFCFYLEPYSRR